jgi:hypothetical protein
LRTQLPMNKLELRNAMLGRTVLNVTSNVEEPLIRQVSPYRYEATSEPSACTMTVGCSTNVGVSVAQLMVVADPTGSDSESGPLPSP